MNMTKTVDPPAVLTTPNQRRRKNVRKQRYVLIGILFTLFLLILVGSILLILPAFKVSKITVKGIGHYTETQILDAAGIDVGTEIFATDWDAVVDKVKSLQYVRRVNIDVRFTSVTIEIEEEPMLLANYGPYWYTLNRDLRVLEISESEELLPLGTRITLPGITGLMQDAVLEFSRTGIDRSYIGDLLKTLEENGSADRVTAIDVSQKFNVSLVLDGTCRVILGSTEDLDVKLERADQILAQKHTSGGFAEINVSDLKNTTYRPLSQLTSLAA